MAWAINRYYRYVLNVHGFRKQAIARDLYKKSQHNLMLRFAMSMISESLFLDETPAKLTDPKTPHLDTQLPPVMIQRNAPMVSATEITHRSPQGYLFIVIYNK